MQSTRRACLLAFFLVLMAAAPAQAALDPVRLYARVANSAHPGATYRSLSLAQQNAVRLYLTPAVMSVKPIAPKDQPAQAFAASGCTNTGNVVAATNVLGMELWRYELYVTWCWSSGRITYSEAHDKGLVEAAFWSWRQVSLTKSLATSITPQRFTVAAQAEFKMCIFADIGCVQFVYPWHTARAYGDGTLGWASGK